MRALVAATVVALGLVALPATAHAKTTWIVTIKSGTTQAVVGHKIVFTGVVNPKGAAAGSKVVLQERFAPGKPWKAQRSTKVDKHGAYRVSDRPSTNTKHSYRVVMAATPKHAQGVSQTLSFKVYGWESLLKHNPTNFDGITYGDVDINGKTYHDSLYQYWSSPSSLEFNVDHLCTKLTGAFGISDDSTTGGQVEVDVVSDGTQIYTHTFDLGEHQTKTLTLDSPLKLQVKAESTSTLPAIGYGAIGTPMALCTR